MMAATGRACSKASDVRLPPLPTISDVLRMYKLRAQKQLSQNFLMDPRLHHKIVRTAGNLHGSHVCEVGPGPGGLTRAILERGAERVVVIEKDRRFMPSLQLLADAYDDRMKIVLGDVMNFPMDDLFPRELALDWDDAERPPIHIIGNLPFNVSTPLIIRWLRDLSCRRGIFSYGRVDMTLTFQREVAERMVAPAFDVRHRCRLTIMCQHLCHVRHMFNIPGNAFVPKPKVDVGVVHFVPRVEPRIGLPFEVVEKFMRNVFHFRQKFCRRGVEVLFPEATRDKLTDDLFAIAEVDPKIRPFCLTMGELNLMANAYHALCVRHPEIVEYDYRQSRETNSLIE